MKSILLFSSLFLLLLFKAENNYVVSLGKAPDCNGFNFCNVLINSKGIDGAPNCNCVSGDDYCGGIIISTGDICNSKLKCTSVSGCGLFWRHSCNGTCQVDQPSKGPASIGY